MFDKHQQKSLKNSEISGDDWGHPTLLTSTLGTPGGKWGPELRVEEITVPAGLGNFNMDVSKNRGIYPKMDGENNGKPY